jgi:hypothetical protein
MRKTGAIMQSGPERAAHLSPGHRPGNGVIEKFPALKGPHNIASIPKIFFIIINAVFTLCHPYRAETISYPRTRRVAPGWYVLPLRGSDPIQVGTE